MLEHKNVATTRRHYQGILASRLKGASDTLAGRFDGWKRQSRKRASFPHFQTRFTENGWQSRLAESKNIDAIPRS
jgi:hypothetical protein